MDKLLLHKIDVYKNGNTFTVPTRQPQYRMVQSMFETYEKYRDSVYYDASAWSVANFYNIDYRSTSSSSLGEKVVDLGIFTKPTPVQKTSYAYIVDYDDYNAVAVLNHLQEKELVVSSSFKPFSANTNSGAKSFNYGALIVPVSLQKKNANEVFDIVSKAQSAYQVPIYAVNSGYSVQGIDLGSRYVQPITKPTVAMIIGDGVRSYEAGEVWHLLDTRVHMPITKIPMRNFSRANLDKYNTLVMVSGNYQFPKKTLEKIKSWTGKGNTLITIGSATKWSIEKELVKEKLTDEKKDSTKTAVRKPYVDAPENIGKESVGGAIFKADLDVTHPLAFGYRDTSIPIYKNNSIWLSPSKNEYATVAKYSSDPHIDGFITKKNLDENLKPSASLVVSKVGSGRAVLFADNPNFRGSWYGTNRLFLNALFLGDKIRIPE